MIIVIVNIVIVNYNYDISAERIDGEYFSGVKSFNISFA